MLKYAFLIVTLVVHTSAFSMNKGYTTGKPQTGIVITEDWLKPNSFKQPQTFMQKVVSSPVFPLLRSASVAVIVVMVASQLGTK